MQRPKGFFLLFIVLPLTLMAYQNCGKSFKSQALLSLSSSCQAQKIATPFQKQKLHVSQSWLKGFRKASPEANQLVLTLDVPCIKNTVGRKSFLGHKLDLQKIPDSMKHYAVSIEIPGSIDKEILSRAVDTNSCILGITEQSKVKKVQFQAAATTVTDPLVPNQEHLDFINFDQSFELRRAGTQKVVVAVIDTGINYNHPDLRTQMWSGPQGERGYNFIAGNNQSLDDDGHGTHVAGIIAAASNNNIGIAGVAGDHVELMSVKVLDQSGDGSVQGVYNGIVYAINSGAEIINLSIEATGRNPLIEQGIFEAINAGVVVTMAAGNANTRLDPNNLFAPAYIGPLYSGAISVASVDVLTGTRSPFSNYSPDYIEIAAPGSYNTATDSGILSTYGNDYLRVMGTSQAAPMITGGAAILMSYLKTQNVGYNPSSVENWLKNVGTLSASNLTSVVHNGDLLDLGALSRETLNAYPVLSDNTGELPGDTSSGNRPPANCLGN